MKIISYEISQVPEQEKTQDLRKLGNIRKIQKLDGDRGQYKISVTETKHWQQQGGGGGGTNSEKNQCAIVFTQFWYADSENLGHFLQKWFLRVLLKVSMTS